MIKSQRVQKTQKGWVVLQFIFPRHQAFSVISIIVMISSFPSLAQVTITGRVTDGSQNLSGATVRMITLDSALVTGTTSDSVGEFALQHVTYGVIRIAVDDLLYINNWRIKTYAPENNLDVYFDYDWHNQFVRVTYSCNLGNTKLKLSD